MQTKRIASSKAGVQRPNRASRIGVENYDATQDKYFKGWAKAEAEAFESWYCKQGLYGEAILRDEQKSEQYLERQESRRYANWLINYHKTLQKGSERHSAVLAVLGKHLIQNEELMPLYAALREVYADLPCPIDSTVFVNPDGSRFVSRDVDFNKAKAAYVKRHKLENSFVSVDRVQLEDSKRSKIVIGVRKPSNEKESSFYDPNPYYTEPLNTKSGYIPGNRPLYLVPDNKVMPHGSYRLTVREFERALIAGAEIIEDDDFSFENEIDDRIRIPDMGYGSDGRTYESLCDDEQVIYDVLNLVGLTEAAELMLLRSPERVDFTSLLPECDELNSALRYLGTYDKKHGAETLQSFIKMMLMQLQD